MLNLNIRERERGGGVNERDKGKKLGPERVSQRVSKIYIERERQKRDRQIDREKERKKQKQRETVELDVFYFA